MAGIVPTPEEVDKAYKRVGMIFLDLLSACRSAQEKASLLSADTEKRYAPIREAFLTESDLTFVQYGPAETATQS